MSYILDALRKSQAERQHRAPVGLDPVDLTGAPAALRRRGAFGKLLDGHSLRWVLAALVAATAALLMMLLWPGAREPGAATGLAAGIAAVPPPPLPSALSAPATPKASTAPPTPEAPPVASPEPPRPPRPAAAEGPRAVPPSAAVPEPATGPAPQSSQPPGSVAAGADRAAATSSPAAVPAPPVRLQDLPAELQRELPAFRVSGSVQSNEAQSRLLLINGQVLRQGESLVPGLVLEIISPEVAVFRWRDLRISVTLSP